MAQQLRMLSYLGGALKYYKTSVVRMRDQRFSKHVYPNRDLPFEETKKMHGFAPNFTPWTRFFWEHILWNRGVWKMTPKCPLYSLNKNPFSWKQARDPYSGFMSLKIQPSFCVSLVYYSGVPRPIYIVASSKLSKWTIFHSRELSIDL